MKVRDVIKILEDDGLDVVRRKASHRQYKGLEEDNLPIPESNSIGEYMVIKY